MKTILLIDDDKQLTLLLREYLKNFGFNIIIARDGKEGIDLLKENIDVISLVIMDISMPIINGIEACKIIREKLNYKNLRILMLTTLFSIEDKYVGFQAGADDYLIKPFEPLELLMRIKSLLKIKNDRINNNTISEKLTINRNNRTVTVNNKEIYLSNLEFELISYLYINIDKVVSPEEIIQNVFKYNSDIGSTETVRTHIRFLRLKIEDDSSNPKIISNIFKRGYILRSNF